ncbi:MAG: hypothetical protein PWP31_1817, partial [Clostridia bacterium]|nr:hypothetical protein [Clostridia bacterium]
MAIDKLTGGGTTAETTLLDWENDVPSRRGNATLLNQNPALLKAKVNEVIDQVNVNTAEITNDKQALTTHKTSADHDSRYYTETEIDTMVTNLQDQITSNDSDISNLQAKDTDLQNQINDNDTDISNLQAKDTDLQNQINTIKGTGYDGKTLATIEDDISALEAALPEGTDLTGVKTRIDAIEAEVYSPDYTDTLTQTSSIFSVGTGYKDDGTYLDVSSSVVNGQVNAVVLKGNTYNGIVKNGNFANGTANWNVAGATHTASNNTLFNTGDGVTSAPNENSDLIDFISGHKYFFKVFLKVTNSSCTNLLFKLIGGGNDLTIDSQSSPAQNTVYTLSGIVTATATGQSRIYCYHQYADAATTNGKTMEIQNVVGIDLTAHGLDSLTVEECVERFPYWWDGVNSTFNTRLRSVGKNIAPAINGTFENWKRVDNSVNTIEGDYFKSSNQTSIIKGDLPVKLKKGVTYTLSATGYVPSITTDVRRLNIATFSVPIEQVTNSLQIVENAFIDFNNNTSPTRLSKQFTPTKDFVDACLYFIAQNGDVYIKEIQLEEGSTATSYEPYKESVSYITLPDGVDGFHSL